MKMQTRPYRTIVSAIAVFSLLTIPLLISSCGGGGGGGGGSNGENAAPVSLQERSEQQSIADDAYFQKVGEFIHAIDGLQGELTDTGSTDIDGQSRIVRAVSEEIVPLADEMFAAGSMTAQSQKLMDHALPSQKRFPPGVPPDPSIPALLPAAPVLWAGVCFATTVTAWNISVNDNFRQYARDMDACGADLERWWEAMPSGLSSAEIDAYRIRVWGYYKECMELADLKVRQSNVWTHVGSLFSVFADSFPASAAGKFTVQFSSAYLDAAQIYLWGTIPPEEENIQGNTVGRRIPTASPGSSNSPTMFITTVDSNGEFVAPVGEWNVIAYKKGFMPLGNPQGQAITISAGGSNEILVNPIPTSQVVEDDLACNAGETIDITPVDPGQDSGGDTGGESGGESGGGTAESASLSGNFSASCSDGYSASSDFSVTIADNGTVSGTYDWGGIAGGVFDNFMSVELDGDWSDCVLGGYLSGSGATLSGSGTVSCSGGNCYGTWSAAH